MFKKVSLILVLTSLLYGCTASAQPSAEIIVELKDFSYGPSSITIPAGQPVTLTLNNTGLVEHDFVVEKIEVTDVVAQDSGSEHHMHGTDSSTYDLHASTGAGQTNTLQFTALEPGTYKIFCSVGGHIEAGMIGELVVVSE
jgi:uncharacterized cupredoxin-like copper-binding protein